MWEKANAPLQAECVILYHLAYSFGWYLTVPKRKIRELKASASCPICDSVVLDRESITYWYRKIDQAILDCLQAELKFREKKYFQKLGFNSINIVFGADHRARRFRALIKTIIWEKEDATVNPISVVINIGNMDYTEETHEISGEKIAEPIN